MYSILGLQRFIMAREGILGTRSVWHAKGWQLAKTIRMRECARLSLTRGRLNKYKIFCDMATAVPKIATCNDAKVR